MTYNLQQRLDACVTGECGSTTFLQELFVVCDASPDSAWDILSLIDQYYRRGKLAPDLFQTLRCRIERHALGIRDDDLTPEICSTRTGAGANIGAARGGTLGMQEQAATAQEVAPDIHASPVESSHVRGAVKPHRKRIRSLPGFRRHTRTRVFYRERELGFLTTEVGRYFERRRPGDRRNAVPEGLKREYPVSVMGSNRTYPRWLVLVAFLISAGLSPVLQDPTSNSSLGKMVTRAPTASPTLPMKTAAAVAATPTIATPGQISLSTDKYIVFPGHAKADISVERTGGASGDVSFVWWTEGSGAKPGEDYVSSRPRVARMPDGVETLHLSVPILVNPARKHTELFYVVVSKPGGGASLGSNRRAAIFILRRD